MSDGSGPTFVGIDHLALNVSDVRRAAQWYEDVLGFESPSWFGDIVTIRHPDARMRLVLQPRGPKGAAAPETFDHVAFRVRDREALGAWADKLSGAGLPDAIGESKIGWSIELEDPDGNEIELFVPRPEVRP